jgi:aldose 1-epimerase
MPMNHLLQKVSLSMLRSVIFIISVFVSGPWLQAGDVAVAEESGVRVFTARQGSTVVKFAPAAGANVFSIRVDEIEYLRQPESIDKLPGVGFGNPVLYPTPNRVKNATFEFEGTSVRFTPNARENFIHGLVNRHAWTLVATESDATSATITCLADFRDGTALSTGFPFPHQLFLTVSVTDGAVRWVYTVDNTSGKASVPFGFALHPYFIYQGERAKTFLKIPATHWMKADQQLPTGELVPKNELDFPLGEFLSLQGTTFDDVFWGMRPDAPTVIEFRDAGRKIAIHTSAEFTHLVVWTPDRPYFGVESQTCSTDAHNLYSAGKTDEAHLQICPPGESMTGWVEYRFGN